MNPQVPASDGPGVEFMYMLIVSRRIRLLEVLHLYGLDHLDPVVLAALADEQPLLLIGPHGTAKSALLNRVAAALGLEHRHYNTSLIAFDDLIGFPVPTADRTALEYVRTPNDLWGAESVFLDEIARCRPEHQNKLFSIILEKRVQGIRLERLRYRWSAMNPAMNSDEEDLVEERYDGCFALDPALADRFAYVVPVPAFHELDEANQTKVVRLGDRPVEEHSQEISALITTTREIMDALNDDQQRWVAQYVVSLAGALRRSNITVSGRRAATLANNTRGIYAACRALQDPVSLEDAGLAALRWGLPHRACGMSVNESKLIAAHRLALDSLKSEAPKPMASLLREPDPVKRVAKALAFVPGKLNRLEFSQLVSDAFAGLPLPEQYLFARHLLPRVAAADCLTSSAYEMLAQPALKLLGFTTGGPVEFSPFVVPGYASLSTTQFEKWLRVYRAVHKLKKDGHPRCVELGNVLYVVFVIEKQNFDPDELIAKEAAFWELFRVPMNTADTTDTNHGENKKCRCPM